MKPLEQFEQTVVAADDYVKMYGELRNLKHLGSRGPLDSSNAYLTWLLRGTVVSCMSSLDAYVHAVLYDLVPALLWTYQAASDDLCDCILRVLTVKKREHVPDALEYITAPDGPNQLFERVKEGVFELQAYQAPDKLVQAYRLIGYDDILEFVANAWPGPKTSRGEIAGRLASYVKRRNQIAHEGDLEQSSGRPRPMTPDYARNCIAFTRGLVTRLDGAVYE